MGWIWGKPVRQPKSVRNSMQKREGRCRGGPACRERVTNERPAGEEQPTPFTTACEQLLWPILPAAWRGRQCGRNPSRDSANRRPVRDSDRIPTPTALWRKDQGWPAIGQANPGCQSHLNGSNLKRGCGLPSRVCRGPPWAPMRERSLRLASARRSIHRLITRKNTTEPSVGTDTLVSDVVDRSTHAPSVRAVRLCTV